MAGETRERTGILVWDLPVRVTHWLLAVCVPLAWVTHELGTQYFRWHRYVGYTVLVLVAFRLAWGFCGTQHARFAAFVRGPRAVVAYLRGRTTGSAGHNPAGGWMAIVMLGLLALQASSGLFANDQIFNTGPFYGWVTPQLSDRLSSLHRQSFYWLLAMIGLHVTAILLYRLVGKVNLVVPMVTGRKPTPPAQIDDAIADSRLPRALLIAALCAAALAIGVRLAPATSLSLSF
jgi:cytochrome b